MMSVASKAEPTLLVEHHHDPEAVGLPNLMAIDRTTAASRSDWTTPFIEYLARGNLPDDPIEARSLARRYKSYMVIGNILKA